MTNCYFKEYEKDDPCSESALGYCDTLGEMHCYHHCDMHCDPNWGPFRRDHKE